MGCLLPEPKQLFAGLGCVDDAKSWSIRLIDGPCPRFHSFYNYVSWTTVNPCFVHFLKYIILLSQR